MPAAGVMPPDANRTSELLKEEWSVLEPGIHPVLRNDVFMPVCNTEVEWAGLKCSMISRAVATCRGRMDIGEQTEKN